MPSEGEFIDNCITVSTIGLLWPLNWNGLKVVNNVSRIVMYAVILIFSQVVAVIYFLTIKALPDNYRDEASFLLMPTWLKYTTVSPSQVDRAICKESNAGDQIHCR